MPWIAAGFAGLSLIFGLMLLLWLLSLYLKNTAIVDNFWGLGFVLVLWLYFLLIPGGDEWRKGLIALLVTVWGLRLSLHIFLRNHGKPEDFRYQAWRAEHGARWWWRSLFQVFLLQGGLLWIIAFPLLAAQGGGPLGILDLAGALVWAVGFFFEAAGDAQLARFLADPANKGKIMDRGVWRYTRHPNYFGDSAQWWGFFLIAASAGGWWTVFSPVIMTLLLVRVSGVALLEKSLETRPGYKEYIERTSAFVPWFPRNK